MITILATAAAVIIAVPSVVLIVPIFCIIRYVLYGKI